MAATEHIQQCVADVLRELPVHGSAVIILVAGHRLPDAVGRTRGSPTPNVELAQRIAIGVFALRESVINAAGPLGHFLGRARNSD